MGANGIPGESVDLTWVPNYNESKALFSMREMTRKEESEWTDDLVR